MENPVSHLLNHRQLLTIALSVALATAATGLGAQSAEAAKPMALRSVMEKLGRDMQAVTGAISKEEWTLVAELAPKIAKHAEPPLGEKMRILGWLGTDAVSISVQYFPGISVQIFPVAQVDLTDFFRCLKR